MNISSRLKKPAAKKTTQIFWNILSVLVPIIGLVRLTGYLLGKLANRIILPAAALAVHSEENESVQIQSNSNNSHCAPHFISEVVGSGALADQFIFDFLTRSDQPAAAAV